MFSIQRFWSPLLIIASLAILGCDDDTTTDTDTVATDTVATDSTADTSADTDADTSVVDCDPVADTGCPEGQTCTYSGADTAPGCFLPGTLASGAACGGEDRCEAGVCLSLNETAQLCYSFCTDTSDCGGEPCISLTDDRFEVCEIADIYQTCDLLAPQCDPGKACYSVASQETPICLPEGDIATSGACVAAGDCLGGDICIEDGEGVLCRRLCDQTTDPDPCTALVLGTCDRFNDDVGFCRE
ncbi:MAG: hypothetical protein ACI9MR_000284 [Myxococcota bacterium]|jgi:hypothetical protein